MVSLLIKVALLFCFEGSMQINSTAGKPVDSNWHLPLLTSKDLSGKRIALPGELPGERTVLLIAFEREQQRDVDGWVAGLHLKDGELPWLEVPVIDNPGAIGRWFIDNGMRRGIEDHQVWKHVVTLYTGKAAFKSAVGITSEATVYAVVADRQGKIIVSVAGPVTPEGTETIRKAMRNGVGDAPAGH